MHPWVCRLLGGLGAATAAFAFTVFAETTVDVPLMRGAGHATQQGFVRITAAGSGTITIDARNDSGHLESTTLSVGAGRTYHFNSDDLEMGGKGIPVPGIGSGFGDAYLQLKADFEFVATSYMRTADGFLTSMGNTLVGVDGESFGTACVYEATIFNPASNTNQVSSLRIVERGGEETDVSVYGIDDDGVMHGPVELKVSANGARTVTSQQLENGDPDLDGTLGDGTGKWRLAVATDGVIVVMNLLQSPTNHLTNLGPVILPATSEANDLESPQGCPGAPPHRLIAQPPSGQRRYSTFPGTPGEDLGMANVDIFNMSFGTLAGEFGIDPNEVQLLRNGVTNLRDGRGALYVKSAGNAFYACHSMRRPANSRIGCSSSNSASSNHSPYLVMVAAFNAEGSRASYSSAGSNLWISAPAGEFGARYGATITADQVGRNRGYDVLGKRGVANDAVNNPHGNYVSTFNGTSAAAPNASGAIALMLEAEPELTWRDVKHVLAKTARQIDADIDRVQYLVGGTLYVAQLPWITNAAGYHFHNWYGFGAVAVDDALEMVAAYTPNSLGELVETDAFTQAEAVSIPDNDGAGASQVLSVEGLRDDANIEAVTLHVDITHPQTNDLALHLTSPAGTQSILNPIFNDALAGNADLDWNLLSNAFYGESPNGDWTIRIVDAARADEGTLNEWSLTFALGNHPDS